MKYFLSFLFVIDFHYQRSKWFSLQIYWFLHKTNWNKNSIIEIEFKIVKYLKSDEFSNKIINLLKLNYRKKDFWMNVFLIPNSN